MRKAKTIAGNLQTPNHLHSKKKKKKEEITSAKLEIIERSEKNFEIGSFGNRKSFKCLKKK